MNKKLWLACGALAIGAVALVLTQRTGHSQLAGSEAPHVLSHVSYQSLSFDQLAAGAQGVYAGRIASVSPTRWNQDGGEYWEETVTDAQGLETSNTAIPYYEIAMDVDRRIVDETDAVSRGGNGRVIVTVIGMSPADEKDAAREAFDATTGNEHAHLAAGQSAVLFARRAEIAWRGGTRTVLQAMGDPDQSVLPVAAGGNLDGDVVAEAGGAGTVDALAARIEAIRKGDATE